MFDHRIEILEYRDIRDEYNDRTQSTTRCHLLCTAYREWRRENLYAGRIVHETRLLYIRYVRVSVRYVVSDNGSQTENHLGSRGGTQVAIASENHKDGC